MPFILVLPEIRGYGRILSAPTVAAAKPPTGRYARRPLRLVCANRFLSGNEPSGLGNQRIGTAFAASLSDGTAVILTYPPRLSIQEWGLCGQNLQKTQRYEIIVNCQLRLWVWESIIELIIIQKRQPAKKAGAASQKGRQTHESCSARPDQDFSCP